MNKKVDWEKLLAEFNSLENREKRLVETCAREALLMVRQRDTEIVSVLRVVLGLVDVMAFSDDLKYTALRRYVSAICHSVEQGGKIFKD